MWSRGVQRPDARGVVGATGRKVSDVGGKENAGDVRAVSLEFADRDDRGGVVALNHTPYIDVALLL